MKLIRNVLIAGFVIVVAGIAVFYFLGKESWSDFSTLDVGVESSVTETPAYVPEISLDYRQKFDAAVDMVEEAEIEELSDYLVVVDISEQKEYVFTSDGELVDVYKIATGADAVPAPCEGECEEESEESYSSRTMTKSVWRISSKTDAYEGTFYGARLMMLQRLVSGSWIYTSVALHGTTETEKLGTPFSLGCVYHDDADIIALYDLVEVGTYVVAVE